LGGRPEVPMADGRLPEGELVGNRAEKEEQGSSLSSFRNEVRRGGVPFTPASGGAATHRMSMRQR
jgi:hypothetical protein